jgi:hypothetical protein
MWKLVNERLIHTTDESRVKFRTNISESILESLKEMAVKNNTHVNYLLENGLKEVLVEGVISFDKETRPKDRIQYKTTYDSELLTSVKEFAKQHNLFINDVIEYSVQFIDSETVKKNGHRYRVE